MPDSDRLAPRLSDPAVVLDEDVFMVARTVKRADAEQVAKKAITSGMLRPDDIGEAQVDDMMLAWVPLWRLDVTVEGFNIGLSRASGVVLPTGGARHRDEIRIVLGRRLLAVDPTAKVKIEPSELSPCPTHRPPGGEVVQPDVDRDEAEREACEAIRRSVQGGNALFSKFETRVRSAALVYYPLLLVRYRYSGAASDAAAPDECHVALSGRTGKIVSEKHPSAWRSIGAKVKKWFS
jgi:hypothetical protein